MNALAPLPVPTIAETATMREIATGLAAPREQIEATFVRVGARLSEGAAILNRVTKVFEALPAELESPQLGEASARLSEVGQQAQVISELFAAELADLTELVAVVAAADHPIAALRRTVKMMGIVAINARVVAAGIVGDSDDFDVFTTDITQLSETANATIQEFTALYRQLTIEVGQAAQQRGQFQNAHADSLSGLAASMDGALAAVARQRAVSVEGSAETGRVSRQIVSRIANAVMALQVGDATRQRIEHVEAGIRTLCDLLEAGTLDDDNVADIQGAIGGLQAAQLTGAAQAFETDIAEASDALRDLSADARAIMNHSRSIYGESSAGSEPPLTALSHAVRNAAIVLLDCETERGKLELVAGAVLRTVGDLLTNVAAVQEIEANMRLVSLNAAVKCAQLGPRGSALNVIARQLRELTGETVAAAETAMTGLQHAARLAKSFGAAANGDATGRVGQLEHEATAALVLLQEVDRSLAEALKTLERDGPNVIALLGNAAETFADQAAISESIRDLNLRLIEQCLPAPGGTPDLASETVSKLWSAYTMDAERRIHEKLLGAPAAVARKSSAPAAPDDEPVAPVSAAEPAEDDLDALFF
tara:strand:- start:2238 stop:4025 length:1788 start_codon:yes stop_codon:yes gene_type:complete